MLVHENVLYFLYLASVKRENTIMISHSYNKINYNKIKTKHHNVTTRLLLYYQPVLLLHLRLFPIYRYILLLFNEFLHDTVKNYVGILYNRHKITTKHNMFRMYGIKRLIIAISKF